MLVRRYDEVEAIDAGQETKNTTLRWLISEKEGAPNFAMRLFEIGEGGHTPLHNHAWEHEAFVLSGQGVAISQDAEHPIRGGAAVFVPGDERHQFRNTGTEPLRILCIVPA